MSGSGTAGMGNMSQSSAGEVEPFPGDHENPFSSLVTLTQWHRSHSKGYSKGSGTLMSTRSEFSQNDILLCLNLILKSLVKPLFKFPGWWYTDWV